MIKLYIIIKNKKNKIKKILYFILCNYLYSIKINILIFQENYNKYIGNYSYRKDLYQLIKI